MSFDRIYLDGLVGKALQRAGNDREFVAYLAERICERMDSGRSMDCDEYRALLAKAQS